MRAWSTPALGGQSIADGLAGCGGVLIVEVHLRFDISERDAKLAPGSRGNLRRGLVPSEATDDGSFGVSALGSGDEVVQSLLHAAEEADVTHLAGGRAPLRLIVGKAKLL